MTIEETKQIKYPFYFKESCYYCATDESTYYGIGLTGLSQYTYAQRYIEKNYSSITAISREEFLTEYHSLIQHQQVLRRRLESEANLFKTTVYSPINESFNGNIV